MEVDILHLSKRYLNSKFLALKEEQLKLNQNKQGVDDSKQKKEKKIWHPANNMDSNALWSPLYLESFLAR